MTLDVQGRTYRVRFEYRRGRVFGWPAITKSSKDARQNVTTTCKITETVGGVSQEFYGETKCHSTDKFQKSLGRRSALARAVKHIDDRNVRRAIWDKYFDQHRDGHNIGDLQTQEN